LNKEFPLFFDEKYDEGRRLMYSSKYGEESITEDVKK
jgi:hypothetical protein